MYIDVCFTARSVTPEQVSQRTAVIIDVLRASSTIAFALSRGAMAVYPVLQVEAARSLAARLQAAGLPTLLAGERQGLPPAGFDLGNSPLELETVDLGGQRLVLTTSNGTRAALAADEAALRLTGCFVNLSAVCDSVLQAGRDTVLICAGTNLGSAFSLEDAMAAGFMVRNLRQKAGSRTELSDAAELVLRAASTVPAESEAVAGLLQSATHGKRLISLGLGDDVVACGTLDSSNTVPTWVGDAFVAPD